MKRTFKLIALVLAVAMMVACFASCGEQSAAENFAKDNTEYFIGATGPLTGDASSYGISVNNGAMLAVEQINAAGGLNGKNFKFEMKDDKATAADAGTGYDSLYEAGMQISIGSVTSGSCQTFASKSAEDHVFFITPSASNADVIAEDNAFRVCFGDPDQGILSAEELTSKFKNIGCIYDNSDAYSKGIFDAFDAKMKELGVEYKVQSFDAENKKDFSTQVEALKDCDVIYTPIYYTEAGLIAKAVVSKGSKAEIFGCDGLDGVADQVKGTETTKIRYITPFDVNSTEKNVKDFVAAYEAKYNSKPDQFAADGYDAVMTIFESMKAAGVDDVTIAPSVLCDKVIEAITAESFSYTGVTGKMTWDKTGACTKVPVIVELDK